MVVLMARLSNRPSTMVIPYDESSPILDLAHPLSDAPFRLLSSVKIRDNSYH